jgi:hypothetical protein
MVGDQIAAILQITRSSRARGFVLCDPNGKALPETLVHYRAPHKSPQINAVRPPIFSALCVLAKKAAQQLDRPFVSVDLMTDAKVAYFGEYMQTPGAPYFGGHLCLSPDFDAQIGGLVTAEYARRGCAIPQIAADPPCYRFHQEFQVVR